MTSLIQRLFARYDACNVTHWAHTAEGQLTGNSLRGDDTAEIRKKAASLAVEAIASGQTQSQVLASQTPQFLVAAALPAVAGEAISVLFQRENLNNAAVWLDTRTREVELAAAHLAIVTNLETAKSHSMQSDVGGDDKSQEPSQATPLHPKWLRTTIDRYKQDARWLWVGCIGIALLGAIPWQHCVSCDVTCEPATRRFVVAPFEGKLLRSLVGPGDPVEVDQVLAILDGGDLRSQIASLQAKIDQAVQRHSAALATGDGSQSQLQRLEIQHLRSEIELLQSRQRNLEIRSPIAGIVVSGDLQRAEGIPLQVGESLFEIAPLDRLIAEIAIPESDVCNVQTGMATSIRLDAIAGSQHHATLTQIHPRSEIRDQDSVFVAEAFIENQDLALRPGMHGTARIHAGYRSIAWLLCHRPYNALRGLIGW